LLLANPARIQCWIDRHRLVITPDGRISLDSLKKWMERDPVWDLVAETISWARASRP
jgi:hypothetical protein